MKESYSQTSENESLVQNVEGLIDLLQNDPLLRSQYEKSVNQAKASLKAISSEFEVVLAGQFSAGKSMLLKALLKRELLYSGEGHATGTLCFIRYAASIENEKAVLTFMSAIEILKEVDELTNLIQLEVEKPIKIGLPTVVSDLKANATHIISNEGGKNKSARAKYAGCLIDLLEGFEANKSSIHRSENSVVQKTISEASTYARVGGNSSVLKQIEYYCHDPLLNGNVLVDTPGIDAPLKKDAKLTFTKVSNPDTAAVICVLQTAKVGDITTEETEIIEATKSNPAIRDRVFWVFNLIDITWYNEQLRTRLAQHKTEYANAYETSALLGFYASMISEKTNQSDRFGLDSIFKNSLNHEEIGAFFNSFKDFYEKRYKVRHSPPFVETSGKPEEDYIKILSCEHGQEVLNEILADSQIEKFREAITFYLIEEKRPNLYKALFEDIETICIILTTHYSSQLQKLQLNPREIKEIEKSLQAKELPQLLKDLNDLSDKFEQFIRKVISEVHKKEYNGFEPNFKKVEDLREPLLKFIDNLSFKDVLNQAVDEDDFSSEAPSMDVFPTSFRVIVGYLENLLVGNAFPISEENDSLLKSLTSSFFDYLVNSIESESKFYRELNNKAGTEACIYLIQSLRDLNIQVWHAVANAVSIKCRSYLRETTRFSDAFKDNKFTDIIGVEQRLDFVFQNGSEQDALIRRALKADFIDKFTEIIGSETRFILNSTIKRYLLRLVKERSLISQYEIARSKIIQRLEVEASKEQEQYLKLELELKNKIQRYNHLINNINDCFSAMSINRKLVPIQSL